MELQWTDDAANDARNNRLLEASFSSLTTLSPFISEARKIEKY